MQPAMGVDHGGSPSPTPTPPPTSPDRASYPSPQPPTKGVDPVRASYPSPQPPTKGVDLVRASPPPPTKGVDLVRASPPPPTKGVDPVRAPSPTPSPTTKGIDPVRASSPSPPPTLAVDHDRAPYTSPPTTTKSVDPYRDSSPPPPPERFEPDLVSSPSPPPTRRGDPDTAASPSPRPTKRARRQDGHGPDSEEPAPRGAAPPSSPFSCYEMDLWTEVANHMDGEDLQRLSYTCHWFRQLLSHDSMWRYAFLRALYIPTDLPNLHPPHPSWRTLYAATFNYTHGYGFHHPDKHIDWFRIGGFVLNTPHVLLTSILPLPQWPLVDVDGVFSAVETMGSCLLTDARDGVWVADMNLARCTTCNPNNSCQGKVQILVARHCELYVDKNYRNGSGLYEDLGKHDVHVEVAAAFAAVINSRYLNSHYTSTLVETKCWTRSRGNMEPKGYATPVAVALSSNLPTNKGISSKFEVMRDMTSDGKIVSVRITQHLL